MRFSYLISILLPLLSCGDKAIEAPTVEDMDHDWDRDGYAEMDGDCNDLDPSIFPGAVEICDGIDNDCNGSVDNNAEDVGIWYQDNDEDGYGVEGLFVENCERPDGYSSLSGDCNDEDAAIHPAAAEICDGLDNDCDLLVDADDDSIESCE